MSSRILRILRVVKYLDSSGLLQFSKTFLGPFVARWVLLLRARNKDHHGGGMGILAAICTEQQLRIDPLRCMEEHIDRSQYGRRLC